MPPYSWLEDPKYTYLRGFRAHVSVFDECCGHFEAKIEEEKKPMMKPKYKIGDKVRINKIPKINCHNNVFLEWTYSKERLIGKVLTISFVDDKDNTYKVKEAMSYEWFHEAWLMPADDKVVIMVDKDQPNKVIARNTSTGKTAEAKCAPGDDFDFYKGAALALQRLSENETPKTEEKKYYSGKVVCVESAYCELFTVGKVYTVEEGYLYDNHKNRWTRYLGMDKMNRFSSVEDVNKYFKSSLVSPKFIEYKGEAGK